jgi:hypothetical protein
VATAEIGAHLTYLKTPLTVSEPPPRVSAVIQYVAESAFHHVTSVLMRFVLLVTQNPLHQPNLYV